ncbi:MAG TPA: GlmU family protein [Cytophagaceae bacterium]|nr:GlmU family protein [Cytophagaceae bacterium]
MNFILFDDPEYRVTLLPLTFTRPVADIRIGIFKISEKWEKYLGEKISFQTEQYLSKKFTLHSGNDSIYINGSVCPTPELLSEISKLENGQALVQNDSLLAYRNEAKNKKAFSGELTILRNTWDIFSHNGKELRRDFELVKKSGKSIGISDPHTRVYNPENIFVEEGAKIYAAILNAENGPIYLGKNSEVQEGAMIRGAFALCEGSVVNMGGKMRGDNTIGPFCKVGGEVSNSVMFAYSNKAHDGFMGNSVIGEWCNFGADSNTSNLKNNYANIRVYSYKEKDFVDSGRQFCGLVMGDHSKSGINIMFDSGTVVGVNASIYGAKYSPKFIPSYSWGDIENLQVYRLDKALDVAERVLARRNITLSDIDKEILTEVFKQENQ